MNDYSVQGHYEIDTVYNDDKQSGVLTLNERFSRRLYAVQITDRKAVTINRALRKLIKQIGEQNIRSITSDNGSEFSYDLVWYNCDPYSSWQSGQNERLNKDLRKYLPKGIIITNLKVHKFNEIIEKVNNKPRRIFNGLSSSEYSLLNYK